MKNRNKDAHVLARTFNFRFSCSLAAVPGTTKEDGGHGATCPRVLGSIEDQNKHGQSWWRLLCDSPTCSEGPKIPKVQVPCLNAICLTSHFLNHPYTCTATNFAKIYFSCQCHLTSKRSMVQLLPSIAGSLWSHSNSLRMVKVLLLRQGGPEHVKTTWSPFKLRYRPHQSWRLPVMDVLNVHLGRVCDADFMATVFCRPNGLTVTFVSMNHCNSSMSLPKVSPMSEAAKEKIRSLSQGDIPVEKRRTLYNAMARRFRNPNGLKAGLVQKYNSCISCRKDRFSLLKEFMIDPDMFLAYFFLADSLAECESTIVEIFIQIVPFRFLW